jgi:uncharacterized protein with HEPN domain
MADEFDDGRTLAQLIETCRNIQGFIEDIEPSSFAANLTISSAVCWQFAILGEAASRFSSEGQKRSSQFPWRSVRDFRNRIVHEYDEIDLAEVWRTAKIDVPVLLDQLGEIQEQINSER